jgi:hypothetical protein
VDVKGLAGKTSWPVDNLKAGKPNHFIVFVCFLDKIKDLTVVPEVYVVPSEKVADFTYTSPGEAKRKVVELRMLRKENGKQLRDAWHLILTGSATKGEENDDGRGTCPNLETDDSGRRETSS